MKVNKRREENCPGAARIFCGLILAFLVFAGVLPGTAQNSSSEYARLKGRQKVLFDNWVKKQNQTEKNRISPAQRHSALMVSQQASYEAITNALTRSRLTNKAGRRTGSPIELVTAIDKVAGEIKGEGGDKQYRIYVSLRKDSVRRLEASKTFHRGKDNHFFHGEYPYNFRQIGKVPTLQISISKDGTRADIDIDYKSSSFPAALFNGHLKSSNSDVRPRRHFSRHTSRWKGLIDWWDGIVENDNHHNYHILRSRSDHFQTDKIGTGQEAETVSRQVDRFLNLWLVQGDLDKASQSVSRVMEACADLDENSRLRNAGRESSRRLFDEMMREVKRRVGRVDNVDRALVAIDPHDKQIRLVDHEDKKAYALGHVTEAHFNHFICKNKNSPATSKSHLDRSRYASDYVTVFGFRNHRELGGALILLWAREGTRWKVVSFDVLSH
jgi:hypothetical protein